MLADCDGVGSRRGMYLAASSGTCGFGMPCRPCRRWSCRWSTWSMCLVAEPSRRVASSLSSCLGRTLSVAGPPVGLLMWCSDRCRCLCVAVVVMIIDGGSEGVDGLYMLSCG